MNTETEKLNTGGTPALLCLPNGEEHETKAKRELYEVYRSGPYWAFRCKGGVSDGWMSEAFARKAAERKRLAESGLITAETAAKGGVEF